MARARDGDEREVVITNTAPAARPIRRVDRNIALVRRLVEEACNEGDLTVLDELLPSAASPDAPPRPNAARLRRSLLEFRAAVPDARWRIEEQIAERDRVMIRFSVRGTFSGALLGLAPPGRPATVRGVVIARFARGRLVDVWLQADLLGLLQQLRVLPALDLAQALTMANVLHAGTLLADGLPP
ncbi:MAG: ester cyclase [Chloroflexota bacterium]